MHKSVLLNETIENLNIKCDGIYVDATMGFGGHSAEILKRIKKGFLFAFDQDDMAVAHSQEKLSHISDNFLIIRDNFENMKERLKGENVTKVNGIMFDLGVSSPQLDIDTRGFSYHKDAKLDMRMDTSKKFSAYDVVNAYSEDDLMNIFYKYGEEKHSKLIARKIVEYRMVKKIETTLELVDIIKNALPNKVLKEGHPGKRIFQAIRIEVNRELDVLEKAIDQALELLDLNGRLCIITFHSLEDRIVKSKFKKVSEVKESLKGLPFIPEEYKPKYKIITNKAVIPSEEELLENNRSRSAKLRVIERIER